MTNNLAMHARSAASFLLYLKKYNSRIAKIGIKYDERFKGTIVGTWIRYWKQLFTDYKDVVNDVRTVCRERPLKAGRILTGLALLWAFAKTNPDEDSFRDSVLKASNNLILVYPSLQRPSSTQHLRIIEKCYNKNMLRRQSFLFFSVIWIDNNSCHCCKFECHCSYLEVSYLQFFRRIIDVGCINRWWILKKKIEDYDVNDEFVD